MNEIREIIQVAVHAPRRFLQDTVNMRAKYSYDTFSETLIVNCKTIA